jgi:hypothetical protein
VITGEGQHSDEQVGILVEPGQRVFQLVGDLRRERVLLLHPVDGEHEDVLVDHLGAHRAVRMTLATRFHHETDSSDDVVGDARSGFAPGSVRV